MCYIFNQFDNYPVRGMESKPPNVYTYTPEGILEQSKTLKLHLRF